VLTEILSHQGILVEGQAEEAFRAAVASICAMCEEAKMKKKTMEQGKTTAKKEQVVVVVEEESEGVGAETRTESDKEAHAAAAFESSSSALSSSSPSQSSSSLQDKLEEYKRENEALLKELESLKEELRVARLNSF